MPAEYLTEARKAIQMELDQLAAKLPNARGLVIEGHSGRSILDWACEANGPDLIIMASHRPGMQDLLDWGPRPTTSYAMRIAQFTLCAEFSMVGGKQPIGLSKTAVEQSVADVKSNKAKIGKINVEPRFRVKIQVSAAHCFMFRCVPRNKPSRGAQCQARVGQWIALVGRFANQQPCACRVCKQRARMFRKIRDQGLWLPTFLVCRQSDS